MAHQPYHDGADWITLDDSSDNALSPQYPTGEGVNTTTAANSVAVNADETVIEGVFIEDPATATDTPVYGIIIGYNEIVTIVGATYVDASQTIASAQFFNYTYTNQSQLLIVAATSATLGMHEVASKPTDTTITLTTALGADDSLTGLLDPVFVAFFDGGDVDARGKYLPLNLSLRGTKAHFYTSFMVQAGTATDVQLRYSVQFRTIGRDIS